MKKPGWLVDNVVATKSYLNDSMSAPALFVKLFKISLALLVFGNSFYLTLVLLNSNFFRKTVLPGYYFAVAPERLTKEYFAGFIVSRDTQGQTVKVALANYEANNSRTFTLNNKLAVDEPPEATPSAIANGQAGGPTTAKDLKLGDQIKLTFVTASLGQKVLALKRMVPSTGVAVIYGKIAQLKDTSFSLVTLGRTYGVQIKGKIKLGPKYKIASVSGEGVFTSAEPKEVIDFKLLKEGDFVNVYYSRTEKDLIMPDRVMVLN